MKHLFIVNPVAGGKDRTQEITSKVALAFSGREDDFEVYVTKFPLDATEKIKRDAQTGETLRVYACGGDGTLNECVNGAAGFPNAAVTHFPYGTGNDFIKAFGSEKSRFFDLSELIDGEVRPIDLISCNGRLSVNICSVGIDARIGTSVHKYSHLPIVGGKGGYIVSTVANLVKGITRPMRVRCANREFDGELSLVCACNGTCYGGSFNPVPSARVDDGLIDFLVVKAVSRLTFALVVGSYARGQFRKYPEYISHLRATEMEIESDEEMVVNIDGEAIYANKVCFELIPGGVNFIFPANMEYFKTKAEKTEAKTKKWEVSIGEGRLN